MPHLAAPIKKEFGVGVARDQRSRTGVYFPARPRVRMADSTAASLVSGFLVAVSRVNVAFEARSFRCARAAAGSGSSNRRCIAG